MRRLLIMASVMLLLGGCTNPTTETGYAPRRLGDSAAIKRGYYAQPFSPEAEAAAGERQRESDMRRPVP